MKRAEKRKNSSEGESSVFLNPNKEAKTAGNCDSVDIGHVSSPNGTLPTTPTPNTPASGINACDNSVFISPEISYGNNTQQDSPNMAQQTAKQTQGDASKTLFKNLPNEGQRQSVSNVAPESQNNKHSQNSRVPAESNITPCVSNSDMMEFMKSQFQAVNKRLDKLEILEQKVNNFESKLVSLWDDIDKRVSRNADRIDVVEQTLDSNNFDVGIARDEMKTLHRQNEELKEALTDIRAKSMMKNLIIGGLPDSADESDAEAESKVRDFLMEDLGMSDQQAFEIQFENVKRMGNPKKLSDDSKQSDNRNHGTQQSVSNVPKPRNVLVIFKDMRMKERVKAKRSQLEFAKDKYMHDQYPPEVVSLRRKLVPIMKKARDDGKDAYIKYNKLIVDGKEYTSGKYGTVP